MVAALSRSLVLKLPRRTRHADSLSSYVLNPPFCFSQSSVCLYKLQSVLLELQWVLL
jgi:hypothetical protein